MYEALKQKFGVNFDIFNTTAPTLPLHSRLFVDTKISVCQRQDYTSTYACIIFKAQHFVAKQYIQCLEMALHRRNDLCLSFFPSIMRPLYILILNGANGFSSFAMVTLWIAQLKELAKLLKTRIKFYFNRDILRNSLMVHSIGWWCAWCGWELLTNRIESSIILQQPAADGTLQTIKLFIRTFLSKLN